MFRSTLLCPMLAMGFVAAMTGCASTGTPESEVAQQLKDSEARIASLEGDVNQRQARIDELQSELASNQLPPVWPLPIRPSPTASTRFPAVICCLRPSPDNVMRGYSFRRRTRTGRRKS